MNDLTGFIPKYGIIVVGALLTTALFTQSVGAQVPPQLPPGMTPEQAAQLVQQRPEMGELVRQYLQRSGLTQRQVRARLRAAGYPSNLLDTYLRADTLTPPDPTQSMVQVISILGLARFTTRDSLLLAGDSIALRLYADSLRADSIAVADSLARLTRELSLFGLDVFRQPTTRFQPVVSGPVGPEYHLGPGDVIVLILTGEVETAEQIEVTREGFVIIPHVGQLYVNNLTLAQFRSVLYDRLGQAYSGVTRGRDAKTHFAVTVARVRLNAIRVIGEVARPGTYQIAATGGVLTALYEAGGLTERGSFRKVEVRRGSELVGRVDLYNYLLGGNVPNQATLASGDVVFVPVRGTHVRIGGEVTRPAIYELKPDETLRDLVQIAGGLTPLAATNTATIDRILPPEERREAGRTRTVLTVDLAEVLDSTRAGAYLAAGDSVHIFTIQGPRTNSVTIQGSVWQPGTYHLEAGMRLWDLIRTAGGLRPETFGGRVQIVRLLPDSSLQMFGAALGDGINPAPADNPELKESDEVTIFATTEFRPQRYVAVFGAVRDQGVLPFADSMTLRDALLLAGGLLDDAYLVEAEVSRLREIAGNPNGDSLALVLRVPLDSSYVFDPTSYVRRPVGSDTPADVILQPYDNIFIRRQPGMEIQRNVVITGEVRFPGRYTLVLRDEQLTSLIERAGGLTSQAYANGIRFFRTEGGAGRIGVNLPEVLRDRSFRDNLVLADGDSIDIPRYIPTVRVEGAVNSPTSVAYRPRAGMQYYIDAAGGYSRQADKGGRFVQQPNGLVEKRARPEPGAAVFVPAKDPDDRGVDFVALFSSVASILAAVTTTLLIALTR